MINIKEHIKAVLKAEYAKNTVIVANHFCNRGFKGIETEYSILRKIEKFLDNIIKLERYLYLR